MSTPEASALPAAFTPKPGLPVCGTLGDFARASKDYTHTFAMQNGEAQIAVKIRRLTMAEMDSVDFPAKVKPPKRRDADGKEAPEDAPFEERFDTGDEGYLKKMVEAYNRRNAEVLHLAVQGGIEGGDAAKRAQWVAENLPVNVRDELLRAIGRISSGGAVELAGFIGPVA